MYREVYLPRVYREGYTGKYTYPGVPGRHIAQYTPCSHRTGRHAGHTPLFSPYWEACWKAGAPTNRVRNHAGKRASQPPKERRNHAGKKASQPPRKRRNHAGKRASQPPRRIKKG